MDIIEAILTFVIFAFFACTTVYVIYPSSKRDNYYISNLMVWIRYYIWHS